MQFPCTGCGVCCSRLGEILDATAAMDHPVFQQLLRAFPYEPKADGSCPMLDGKLCSVYDNRPLLCNLSMIQYLLKVPDVVWMQLNGASCNNLIRQAGLGEEWMIKSS